MSYWHLPAADSSLVLGLDGDQLCLYWLGPRLSEDAAAAVMGLQAQSVPHGELDRVTAHLALPTEDEIEHPLPALKLSRDGRRVRCRPVFSEVDQREGARFTLRDSDCGVDLTLTISADAADCWVISTTVTNHGNTAFGVDWLASAHIPLPSGFTELQQHGGFWANEFKPQAAPLGPHRLCWDSARGRSGHHSSASLFAISGATTDKQGPALAAILQWPGNHRLQAGPLPGGGQGLQAGVLLAPGELSLAPGESFTSPNLLLAYSAAGLNGLRQRVARYWRAARADRHDLRPVHFNSWEGCYFSHDEALMLSRVEAAAALGAERFVVDDGWMQDRTGPGVGLGDWRPCPQRYPRGLKPIADRARELKLSFGLWVEPEMVTPDSRLAKEHPEWVIGASTGTPISGRQQYLLDLTRADVRNTILARLRWLIDHCQPDYLKWDMNRDYAQIPDHPNRGPLAMTRGWLELIERIRAEFPDIAIEVCGAGGARSDAGAMLVADRLWPTDSLDPLQRFEVQRQASLLLPPERLGWHVGTSPTETSGVSTPLSTRCALTLLGHAGLELDPTQLKAADISIIKHWMSIFKDNRDWLAEAEMHWLDPLPTGAEGVMMVAKDRRTALLIWLQRDYPSAGDPPVRCLPGLCSDDNPNYNYAIELLNPEDCAFAQHLPDWLKTGLSNIPGDALTAAGLRQPPLRKGHCAVILFNAEPG
jgi:alpha-galactosidase